MWGSKRSRILVKNTSMLLLLNIAKLVFSFITLPYLTRVLSTEVYGVVAYVKAFMNYMQVIVDFGFMLSATKQIVEAKEDKRLIGQIVSQNIVAKICLAATAGLLLVGCILAIPILRNNILYTLLSYAVVVLSVFLPDFLFRGIEQMQMITIRFVILRSISTACTFLFVKTDADMLLIPIFDIVGTMVTILWIGKVIRKLEIPLVPTNIKESLGQIKTSAIYFGSNVATTSFNVFNTVAIGLVLPPTEVAYWSVCMQIVNAIQALFMPISDAIYPEMIRSKDIGIVKKIIKRIGPVIFVGAAFVFWQARLCLHIVGGDKYVGAYVALRIMTPLIVISFFSVLLGWPTLGAIGKQKETTKSTVIAVAFQMLTVLILWGGNQFTLLHIAVVRTITEAVMCSVRYYYYSKFKNLFAVVNH